MLKEHRGTRAAGPEENGFPGIGRLVHDYRRAKLLFLAARLELFDLLDHGGLGLGRICGALGLKPRPAQTFLDALAAAGFLVKKAGLYSNTTSSSRFLVKGKPEYFGHILKFQDILWPAWGDLEHVLRKGSPRRDLEGWMRASKDFTEEYIQGMRRVAREPAREVARLLSRPGDIRLLDVGGGPGTFSLAMLEENPKLKAVILDLPATLRVAGKLLRGHALRKRIRLIRGDYRRLRLARDAYDVILLSHMTHNEGPSFNKRLISRCRAALRPGGRLAVHDFMTDEGGVSPAFSAMFSVHMMTFTKEGAVYGVDRYEEWMREARLAGVRRIGICPGSGTPSMLVVGTKL